MIWLEDYLASNSSGTYIEWTTQCKFVLWRYLMANIRLWTREFRLLNHIFLFFFFWLLLQHFFLFNSLNAFSINLPIFSCVPLNVFHFFLHNAKQHTIFCRFLLVVMKEGTGALFRINSCFILSIYVCDVTIMHLRAHAQIHLSE